MAIGKALAASLGRDAQGRFLPRGTTGVRKRRRRKKLPVSRAKKFRFKREEVEERMETSRLTTAKKIVKAARIIGAPIPGAGAALDIAALFGIL